MCVCVCWQAAEANKLALIAKEKERAAEANQRIQEQVGVFVKETEKKISEKMESAQENREAQLKALQDKLQEHVSTLLTPTVILECRRMTFCLSPNGLC